MLKNSESKTHRVLGEHVWLLTFTAASHKVLIDTAEAAVYGEVTLGYSLELAH